MLGEQKINKIKNAAKTKSDLLNYEINGILKDL